MKAFKDGFKEWKEWTERLIARIGGWDSTKLKKLETQLSKVEKTLQKLKAARNKHQNKAPEGKKLPIEQLTLDQLIEVDRTGDAESAGKYGSWMKVDWELRRRIMTASQEVSRLKDAITRCNWQPIKNYGDNLADNIVASWRSLDESLTELQKLERLELSMVGLSANARFNPRSVDSMKDAIKKWADSRTP